jgi:hypothetical protein
MSNTRYTATSIRSYDCTGRPKLFAEHGADMVRKHKWRKLTIFLQSRRSARTLLLLSHFWRLWMRHSLKNENEKNGPDIGEKRERMICVNENITLLIMSATVWSMIVQPMSAVDQNTEQQFRAVAIRQLISKLDRRLIPFLFLLEMSSYINRNSLGMYFWIKSLFIIDDTFAGYAKLMGIEKDLHMSSSETDWAISIFFLAYVRENISRL